MVAPGPTGWIGPPVPMRVSRIREGVSGLYWVPEGVASNQPARSATTCTDPELLAMSIQPSGDTVAITRLGIVSPAAKLRFEVAGFCVPVGYTVRKLGAVVSVAVTLRTTALVVPSGTPLLPPTC